MNGVVDTVTGSIRDLIGSAVKILPALLIGLVLIFVTSYVARWTRKIVTRASAHTIRSTSLQLLIAKTSFVAVWILGILVACVVAFPGFNLGDIIATLGLGSVAIGFAFQDIFKNFLAGILLLLQEPFRINDQIIVNNYEGTVEKIDIRTTKIRTYTGERVLLPNSTVFTSAVQVRTAFDARRTDLAVGVDYNTPLPKASQILQQIISRVEGVLDDPSPEIDLVNFGDSSIDFIVRYWTVPYQKEVRTVQTRAIVAIKKAFDREEINIPYPIRTVYYYDQEQFNDYLAATNGNKNSQDSLPRS